AEALHARTQCSRLLQRILDGNTERLELWELLSELGVQGADAEQLWRESEPSERLCRLIPPLHPRVYSISSSAIGPDGQPNPVLELTVGHVRYNSHAAKAQAHGTASTFLIEAERHQLPVPFTIERPDRFVLPEDASVPLLMFAGGTGVSPFRAFIQARAGQRARATDWLFLSLRGPDDFLYAAEWESSLARGSLELQLAFTRVGAVLTRGKPPLAPGPTRRVDALMQEHAAELYRLMLPRERGGAGAHVYICGSGGFAASVLEQLERIVQAHAPEGTRGEAQRLIYRLAGEGRLMQEIHTDAEPDGEDARRFHLSEVAQHNSAERGFWIILDGGVYDVTELMELHPGGRRIVQAYAGMDASHGFARAHHQRADVNAMRDQYRIGTLIECTFDAFAARVEGPSGPVTVDCTLLHRAFVSGLHMVVEMQNAFAADVSLQQARVGVEAPHEQSPYKLARAFESHQRFQRSYLNVLTGDTLPQLWLLSRGLLFPAAPLDWMRARLEQASSTTLSAEAQLLVDSVWEQLDAWLSDPRAARIQALLLELDGWLLAEVKADLTSALRAFERLGPLTRSLGAGEIRAACERCALSVERYHERLSHQLSRALSQILSQRASSPRQVRSDSVPQRLHTGTYWTLEVDAARKLAILQRTPLALASLADLSRENEQILHCLDTHHREYGLVVDTRRAPLRNDSAFEDTMARLRSGLTGHFKRTAVLLESQVGELQVTRLERDERRPTLATRSESAALKHALGGS
ncbi:MAG TPA: cytochrome b5 domain-containing protein, partial [Polyangiales bacterium]